MKWQSPSDDADSRWFWVRTGETPVPLVDRALGRGNGLLRVVNEQVGIRGRRKIATGQIESLGRDIEGREGAAAAVGNGRVLVLDGLVDFGQRGKRVGEALNQ